MATPRGHLGRAPIAEALIDLRVGPREGAVLADLEPFLDRLRDEYPRQKELRALTATIQVRQGTPTPPSQSERQLGWALTGKDGHCVAQVTVEGFTFSRLRPYTRWKEVLAETMRLWQLYVEVVRPVQVRRVATRYINRLNLPTGSRLGDVLAAPPTMPAPIPQVLEAFFTRVLVRDPAFGSAFITQALEVTPDPSASDLILDIDAFREGPLPPNDPEIEARLQHLRQMKNRIFFACITERAAEAYS